MHCANRRAGHLQQLEQLVARQCGLAKDRAERARRKVAIAVNRDDDETLPFGTAQVMMATADVDDLEACSPERSRNGLAAESWSRVQRVATSSSTTSGSRSESGTGSPSVSAASK